MAIGGPGKRPQLQCRMSPVCRAGRMVGNFQSSEPSHCPIGRAQHPKSEHPKKWGAELLAQDLQFCEQSPQSGAQRGLRCTNEQWEDMGLHCHAALPPGFGVQSISPVLECKKGTRENKCEALELCRNAMQFQWGLQRE